jgi:hypothetical protein
LIKVAAAAPARLRPLEKTDAKKTPLKSHHRFSVALQRRCWSSPTMDPSTLKPNTKVVPKSSDTRCRA